MTLVWSPSYSTQVSDSDAQAYIEAVETADNQQLEIGVAGAINTFVVGCKLDGVWDAIKASCILAGARTLSGALVPLKGTAPTNNNFVSGDYNRETGLVGDASTKYLDSNRNNNADPQDSFHISVYISQAATSGASNFPCYIGGGSSNVGSSVLGRLNNSGNLEIRSRNNNTLSPAGTGGSIGFLANTRNASSGYAYRAQGVESSVIAASQTPANIGIGVFHDPAASVPTRSNARLSFYSIGENLDLALLDTRVSTLMTDIGAAIP